MRSRQHRHPVLEAAVFAAALLLAAFVGRELWLRRAAAPSAASSSAVPVALDPAKPPLPSKDPSGRTETAVTAVPSIKLSRVQRRKPKTAPVPVPK